MKYGYVKRILSLVLCVCMVLPLLIREAETSFSAEEEASAFVNYGAMIGALAEWDVGNTLFASNHYESGPDIKNGLNVELFPAKLTIVNYAYDEVNDQLWYKVDAAPGYTWPEEYASYHWVYDYAVKIISEGGMTGIFDSEGNSVSELTLPLYEKATLTADTSLQGGVSYQWQIEYETDKWVDIYGANKADLTVSIGLIASLLTDGAVNLRCVASSASKTSVSDSVPVIVDFDNIGGGDSGDGGEEEEPSAEATLDVQMNGASVSVIKCAYGDYRFTAPLTLVASGFTGEVAYAWQLIKNDGTIVDLTANGNTYTLDYDTIKSNIQPYDSTMHTATLSVTVSDGTNIVTKTVDIQSLSNSTYDYLTTEGGDIKFIVAGSGVADTTLELTQTTSSVSFPEGETALLALDITLRDADGNEWQPAEGETVTITIDAYKLGLKDGDYFAVYHVHEGETQLLGPYQVKNGYVTFEVLGFSEFVISTNYGAAIGAVAEFAYTYVGLSMDAEFFMGMTVDASVLPEMVVIKNYYFNEKSGLYYEIDAAPGYTWPEAYEVFHWCTASSLTNVDIGGIMGMVDENGAIVSYVELPISAKPTYTAQTSLTGDVKYQWQICYDVHNYLWMDIEGQTAADITVSYALLASMLDDNGVCAVRCMISNAFKQQEGYPLVIAFTESEESTVAQTQDDQTEESDQVYTLQTVGETLFYASSDAVISESEIATVAETSSTVLVTVQFVMGNDTAPIENGLFTYNVPYNGSVTDSIVIPTVEGYAAYLEDDRTTPFTGTYSLSRANVTEPITITLRFWPAEVSYKVVYMQQNILDDGYTVVRTDDLMGLTGSDPDVADVTYEGFLLVWRDTDKIASDGSTVIEVKYDRLYYKMLFDLDGGYGVQPVYARYGTPVTVNNPTKAGHIFMGWNAVNGPRSDGDDTSVDIQTFTGIEIPNMHTNYTALWQASETATVTVVIWGQNPDDDGYSYMADASEGLSFESAPGTSVTYNPNGGYVCGLDEHTHGTDCGLTCTQTEHTHTLEDCYELTCTQVSHTHSVLCYPGATETEFSISSDEARVRPTDNVVDGQIGESYTAGGIFGLGARPTGNKYIRYGDKWYKYEGTAAVGDVVSMTCGQEESNHVHSVENGCYVQTCSTPEHTHNATCYANCDKVGHTHGAGCTLTVNMSSNLWTFSHSDTITVAADGTSVLNIYYDRTEFTLTFNYDYESSGWNSGTYNQTSTITARWGADIGTRFLEVNTAAKGNLWSEDDGGGSPWTSYLQIMPERDIDYYCRYSGSREQSAEYYTQNLDGTYTLAYTVTAYYDDTLTISKEDFYAMEGYTYSHGTDGDGGSMPSPGSYGDFAGAKFYYTRNNYNLVFDNYNTTVKNEAVQYEASLTSYASYTLGVSYAPEVYQAGSVTFKGWYLSPQVPGNFNFETETPFDFANGKMPASDLKLYAWWQPVTHDVTFYYDMAALEAGTVYEAEVDGETITYAYKVPHGSAVQNPYTPPVDPTSNYYSFVGWFYKDANGNESMWDFENSTVTEDIQLYGKWNSTTAEKYTVRFVYKDAEGNETEIADPITGKALGGTTKTFDAKFGEDLYTDYQTRYYPLTTSHSITIDLENTENNTYTFYYEYVAYTSYKVQYLDSETGKPMSEIDSSFPAEKTVSQNTHAMVTETFVAIAGYLPDAYQKVFYIDPHGENVITFYYTKDEVNGLYTIHIYLEDVDGNFVENVEMQITATANIDSTVTAPTDTVIANFYYDSANAGNVSSGTISKDAVAHLYMYYKRTTHPYTVNYLEAGTNKVLATQKIGAAQRWETLVTETAIAIENYEVYGQAEQSIEISVDETKNVINFYYTEKEVTLNYKVVGVGGTVAPESETVKVISGVASGSIATPSSSAYKFVGWYSDEACENLISTDETYVPTKESGALWVDGTTYYAKFDYNLTSLTIAKEGCDGADVNQSFLFKLTDSDGLELTVTVHGNSSVTIDGLTVGKTYKIVEITSWSWRYDNDGVITDKTTVNLTGTKVTDGAEFTLNPTGNTITFTNKRNIPNWLDGDSWCNNIFK